MKKGGCCNSLVKAHFIYHNKCSGASSRHKVFRKSGLFLNQFCVSQPFVRNEKYEVCKTMYDSLKRKEKVNPPEPILYTNGIALKDKEEGVNAGDVSTTVMKRSERYKNIRKRRAEIMTLEKTKKIKTVHVTCNGEKNSVPISLRYRRRSPKEKFLLKLNDESFNFKMRFRRLKWRSKMERIDDVAVKIIATCIDKNELKNEN